MKWTNRYKNDIKKINENFTGNSKRQNNDTNKRVSNDDNVKGNNKLAKEQNGKKALGQSIRGLSIHQRKNLISVHFLYVYTSFLSNWCSTSLLHLPVMSSIC